MKTLGNKTVKSLADAVFPLNGGNTEGGEKNSECSSPFDPINGYASRKILHLKLKQLVKYLDRLSEDSKNRILTQDIKDALGDLDNRMETRKSHPKSIDGGLSEDIIQLTNFINDLYEEEVRREKEAKKAQKEAQDKQEKEAKEAQDRAMQDRIVSQVCNAIVIVIVMSLFIVCVSVLIGIYLNKSA